MQIIRRDLYFRLLFFVLLTFAQSDVAYSKVIEGLGLAEPLSIELDFDGEASGYAVVRVSQESADYVVELYDKATGELKKQVDILAHYILDEVILVEPDDCRRCELVVYGKKAIHQNSPYLIEVNYLPAETSSKKANSGVIETLRSITSAGEYSYKSPGSGSGSRQVRLEFGVSALKKAHYLVPEGNNEWEEHAQFLSLQLFSELLNTSKVKELAENIVANAKENGSRYLAQSYLELGKQAGNTITIQELYRKGMLLAKQRNAPALYAQGANYLAINLVNDGTFGEAFTLLEEVREIYSTSQNWRLLIAPLHNLSWANLRAGNIPKSIAYAAELKLLAEQYSDQESVVWALYDISRAYRENGNRFEADQFLEEALSVYRRQLADKVSRTTTLYGALLQERAKSLMEVGDFDAAKDNAAQAKKFYQALGDEYRASDVTKIEGEIAIGQKKFSLARELLGQLIEYSEGNMRPRLAGSHYLSLAELEMMVDNNIAAADYQAAAFRHLSNTEDYMMMSLAFSQAVELLSQLGAHSDARDLAEKTAKFVNRYGREHDRAAFLLRRAKVEHMLNRDKSALEFLGQARLRVEQNLPKVKRRDLKRDYFALQRSIYELSVTVLIESGQSDRALQIAESYKARTLNEVINSVRSETGENEELSIARESILKEVLAGAQSWYGDKGESSTALARMRELSSKLERVEVKYAATSALNIKPLDEHRLPELPAVDRDDELMLYYFLGVKQSWLWRIEADKRSLFALPSEEILKELAIDVRMQISQHPNKRSGARAWEQRKALIDLGNTLLGPVKEDILSGKYANITVVSDGALNGLPFSPLLLDGLDGPLIKHVAISYLPSAASRHALDRRAILADRQQAKILLVADPETDDDLDTLPFSRVEADKIRTSFRGNATSLIGPKATKKNMLQRSFGDYNILHFATHGLLNSQEPSLSGLLFSPGQERDRYWLAPEISGSNIQSGLVVLSACESSIGKAVAGEGLLSLSRAFFEGGASHVVGSLWKVEDASTAQLMSHFYSFLLDDSLVVSIALQRAQIAIFSNKENDWRDPYFWAGFQLQGGWHTLAYGSNKDS